MSNIQRALLAASFALVAASTAYAQAPAHSQSASFPGGAVAVGSDNNTGRPAAPVRAQRAAPVRNFGVVAVGSDSASGAPVARPQAAPARPYQGATVGVRAVGSDR